MPKGILRVTVAVVVMLFCQSGLVAEVNDSDRCQAINDVKARLLDTYLPGERLACENDSDCTIAHIGSPSQYACPTIVNKKTAAANEIFLRSTPYRDLAHRIFNLDCARPVVKRVSPGTAICEEKVCKKKAEE